ncbi:MAG: helix-turn-helix domain-containing protein [Acidimicrobiia bacterium]|nr:SRPBCC domain-containing protein [Acidimicrobiia bacterium]NNF09147.1 helix-turn-helix domain-containing protein [Acidimicrobiia bacterium]NNL70494.1 helix-turn-helix domain-containing protein [Acidimicrobiia bacterium]
MDEVFRALNDPSRRLLLDSLFVEDGQSLGRLCTHLPDMTRFGVMSHLRVLEEAGLITTRRSGRSKLHYLNPIPIRLVHDRWISKYTEPTVGAIAGLKAHLEGGDEPMSEPSHVYQAFIAADVKEVWKAITDGDYTVRYFYGTRVESEWTEGSAVRYLGGDGSVVADGEVIAIDPPHRLEYTFTAHWDPELTAEGPAREVWLVEDVNGASKLTVELYDAPAGSKTYEDFTNGFPYIVSGLKSVLETGKSLPAPY